MPEAMNRLTISRGPAVVKFKGATFFSKDDITLDFNFENGEVQSSAYGKLTDFRKDVKPKIKLNLVGEVEDLGVLFPYAAAIPGQSIFGAQDFPLEICPMDTTQQKCVFHAAGISKMPDLTLGAEGVALGEMEFSLVRKNKAMPNAADAFFAFASNDYDGTGLDMNKILIQSYDCRWLSGGTFTLTYGADTTAALAWNATAQEVEDALNALTSITSAGGVSVTGDVDTGYTVTFDSNGDRTAITGAVVSGMPGGCSVLAEVSQEGTGSLPEIVGVRLTPWNRFPSREGVKVSFDLQTTEDKADSVGTYDIIFRGLNVKATMIPQNVPQDAALAAANVQGSLFVRGRTIAQDGHTLRVYASGLCFELRGAGLTKAGLVWSSEKQRVPELEWSGSRTLTGGVVQPLFYIGEAAPA